MDRGFLFFREVRKKEKNERKKGGGGTIKGGVQLRQKLRYASFFQKKKTRYVIILIHRREVVTQLLLPAYKSKDAPRHCLSKALAPRSFEQFMISLRAQLCIRRKRIIFFFL